jgi:hypothetical protein
MIGRSRVTRDNLEHYYLKRNLLDIFQICGRDREAYKAFSVSPASVMFFIL